MAGHQANIRCIFQRLWFNAATVRCASKATAQNMKRQFDKIILSLFHLSAFTSAFFLSQRIAAQTNHLSVPDRPELGYQARGNFENNIERPLRYWPVNGGFVITNGSEFFNRPLYCMNSAFRIDGGDKPEFSLYLPGRGGNLRLGIKTSAGTKWLDDAQQIISRYDCGMLIYEITDPLLGHGTLRTGFDRAAV